MHVLFVHSAFPAQFGRLALELGKRYGWECSFLVESLSNCPPPSREMLSRLRVHRIRATAALRKAHPPAWPQVYEQYVLRGQALFAAARALAPPGAGPGPGLRPDLVVGHGGLLPVFFLRELFDCPFLDYCEYYFRPGSDVTYRIDLPAAEPARFFPRCINAGTLASLSACEGGYSPTLWQRDSFPERFRHKIEVHFDGIDTGFYRPRRVRRAIGGDAVPPGMRIVTYVARGLESVRGFDLFMRLAARIARERSDVLFVVVGEERSFYGWDELATGGASFKEWALSQEEYDLSRVVFLGRVPQKELVRVLCLSDLHVYLTVPFVPSWSLFNALACGCLVLAGDVAPVREVIAPGRNGLLEPLFDTDRMVEMVLRVLDDPAAFRPLRLNARALAEGKYSVEVAVPALKDYLERLGRPLRPKASNA